MANTGDFYISAYFSNTSWLLFDRILRIGGAVVVSALVIRQLGPNDFGILSYSIGIASIFTVLANCGMNGLLPKELLASPDKEMFTLETSYTLLFITAVISAVLCAGFLVIQTQTEREQAVSLLVSGSLFFNFHIIYECYFNTHVKAKYFSLANLLVFLVSSFVRLIFVGLKLDLIWFAALFTAESALLHLSLQHAFRVVYQKRLRFQFDGSQIIKLFSKAFPLILSGVLSILYMKTDQLVIKHYLTSSELGYYSAALRLSESWYFLPVIISASFYPSILSSYNRSSYDFQIRLGLLYDLLGLISVAGAIGTYFVASPIVSVLFGTAYSPAANVLKMHIWAGVFVAFECVLSKGLIAANQQRLLLLRSLIGVLLNLLFNVLLVPRYGIIGSAVATTITYIASIYIFCLCSSRTHFHFRLMTLALFAPLRVLKIIQTLKTMNRPEEILTI